MHEPANVEAVGHSITGPVADKAKPVGLVDWLATSLLRILLSLFVPLLTFLGLYVGFVFLRDSQAPKGVIAVVAIVWGVGGVAALYMVSNWLIEKLDDVWRSRLLPFVFVGPAVAILMWYLALPTVRTFWISLFDANNVGFVGLSNYVAVFTDRNMFTAFRNNLMWIVFGSSLNVIFGLLIAVLADRSRFEGLAKSLIFVPYAISMVGAGVIFNMIYNVSPNIGMLNAVYTGLTGNQPLACIEL